MSDLNNKPVKDIDDMHDKQVEKMLTKGGPGDRSTPGNVNTEEWWKWENLSDKTKFKATKTIPGQPPEDKSILQQAKDKDIWFCTIPFTQVYNEISGKYRACCFGKDAEHETIKNTTLKEWMVDSEYMNSIRKEMLDPKTDFKAVNDICRRCRSDEDKYGRSRRTNCLKIHTNDKEFWDNIQKNVELYKASGKWAFDERILEIQLKVFGSECNLDCFMCVHANSTTRQRVAEKGVWNDAVFGERGKVREDYMKLVMADKTEGVTEQVLELLPYVRSIKVIGGEPLIMKKHYELLEKVIESGHAKHIYLKYQTNLTKTKKGRHNIFNYIPHFKNVSMVASVDGIGKTIEYMRRRTEWEEVVENIEMCRQHPNVVVDFNGLVSNLSVMRFYEVIDWCKDNPVIDQLNWAMIDKPKHLRPNNLPEKIKKSLIPKYKDWPDIVAALERPADPDVDLQNVFDYMLKADKFYEGTKWESHLFDVFPELEEFYDPTKHRDHNEQAKIFQTWDKSVKEAEETSDTNII
jgi:organic radical activating enzyme